MCTENYHWHHDYVRLAWDSGFCFDIHKSKSNFDWSTIGLVDVERVARDRDVASVEKQIPIILHFSLDDEQTRVLEPTFVKVFRLSQLSLQYLQFCKKYLDNTVVLLKKDLSKLKEDNANLYKNCDDQKQEISILKKKLKDMKMSLQFEKVSENGSFKCNECFKMFMSEEFLIAHVKRRHDLHDPLQTETNKLHLEIKELKERLNCTEKYIQGDHNLDVKEKSHAPNNDIGAQNIVQVDLHDKFEELKHHVERELNSLKDQKHYQEKYEKWFEMLFLRLDQSKRELHNKEGEMFKETHGDGDKCSKKEISTQTDEQLENEMELASGDNVSEMNENQNQMLELTQKLEEDLRIKSESHIEQIQGVLEEKLTGSFEQIQTQMETFWKKISDMELEKSKEYDNIRKDVYSGNINDPEVVIIKPKPAPRVKIETKYPMIIESKPIIKHSNLIDSKEPAKSKLLNNYPSSDSPTDSSDSRVNTNSPKHKINPTFKKPLQPKPINTMYDGQVGKTNRNVRNIKQLTSSESESSESEKQNYKPQVKKSSTSTLGQRSLSSLKQAAKQKEVLEGLKVELEEMVNLRLKEVGVAPHWKGLPNRSYKQVLQVINHQAKLTAKKYSNYSSIRKEILKNLDRQIAVSNVIQRPNRSAKRKIQYEAHNGKFSRQQIEKVIDRTKHNEVHVAEDNELSDTSHTADISSRPTKITPIKSQTPVKKKVFFDLKDSSSGSAVVMKKKLFLPQNVDPQDQHFTTDSKEKNVTKTCDGISIGSFDANKINSVSEIIDGGSSTSVSSFVLDDPKKSLNETKGNDATKMVKDDISDWDISDILM